MNISHRKKLFTLPLLAGILFCTVGSPQAQPAAPTEYDVKAAFLYNFAKFVEWPPETFKNSDDAFVIGILGEDPFGKDLEEGLSGKTVQNKKLVFKRLDGLQEASGCQVIFISPSEENHLAAILKVLKGSAVLTVSDIEPFIQKGGMVGFILEDKRVRFSINLTAAQDAGLKISSQLLKLARVVQGKPAEPAD